MEMEPPSNIANRRWMSQKTREGVTGSSLAQELEGRTYIEQPYLALIVVALLLVGWSILRHAAEGAEAAKRLADSALVEAAKEMLVTSL